ncbi:MAG: hypothetical protein ACOYMR_04415 [Ilumatobacteraceae bacterium]
MRAGRVAGRGVGAALVVMLAVLSLGAGVASAHDPIIIADRQTTPDSGPVLPDGTISFALYGVVHGPDDTRGFQVGLAAGDRLSMSLLVPALDPEQSLAPDELPMLQVARPDGSTFDVRPTERVVFDESFSKTSYVRLAEVDEAAQPGDYRVTIVGHAPARFTVSVGSQERFGTPVQQVDDRSVGVGGVQAWYAAAPAANATTVPTTVPATPATAVDATAVAASDAPDTTPAADTVPPAAVSEPTDAAAVTSSVPGAAPTLPAQNASGVAGSAVFFGAIAVIVAAGAILYVRRSRR